MRLQQCLVFATGVLAVRRSLVARERSAWAPQAASGIADAQMPQQTYDPNSSDVVSGDDIADNSDDGDSSSAVQFGGGVFDAIWSTPSSTPVAVPPAPPPDPIPSFQPPDPVPSFQSFQPVPSIPAIQLFPSVPPVQAVGTPFQPAFTPQAPSIPTPFAIPVPDVIPDILKPQFMPPPMPAYDESSSLGVDLPGPTPVIDPIPLVEPSIAPQGPPEIVAPQITELTSQFYPNSRRLKVRYGPFKAKGWEDTSLMRVFGSSQGVTSFVKFSVGPPCSDCILTYAAPNLEYADGSDANTHNGVWLHSLIMSNNAHADPVCPKLRERFFGSGNERSIIMFSNVNNKQLKTGYHLGDKASFGIQLETFNVNNSEKTVYLTVTWEFIVGRPFGWRKTRPLWLDIGKCSLTPGQPGRKETAFDATTGPWRSTISGTLVTAGGHISEGGDNVLITKNQDVLCNSKATYGQVAQFYGPTTPTSAPINHISFMQFCWLSSRLEQGDLLSATANYDDAKHPYLKNSKGQMLRIAGTGIVYVSEDGI